MAFSSLYAILAAFCAILSPLLGMGGGGMNVGARVGCWAGGDGMPTARDYVQDGLIIHFDAIENVAYGTHDSSSSVWNDLSNTGSVATLFGGAYFGDNTCNFMTQSWSIDAGTYAVISKCPNWMTMEFVATLKSSRRMLIGWNGDYSGRGIGNYKAGTNSVGEDKDYTITNQIPFTIGRVQSFAFVKASSGGVAPANGCYVNGNIASSLVYGDSGKGGRSHYGLCRCTSNGHESLPASFHTIRCYNRALTAAEIAHNYAVDQRRFNLP